MPTTSRGNMYQDFPLPSHFCWHHNKDKFILPYGDPPSSLPSRAALLNFSFDLTYEGSSTPLFFLYNYKPSLLDIVGGAVAQSIEHGTPVCF